MLWPEREREKNLGHYIRERARGDKGENQDFLFILNKVKVGKKNWGFFRFCFYFEFVSLNKF